MIEMIEMIEHDWQLRYNVLFESSCMGLEKSKVD